MKIGGYCGWIRTRLAGLDAGQPPFGVTRRYPFMSRPADSSAMYCAYQSGQPGSG